MLVMKTHKIHWIHCFVEGYISLYWAFSMEWIISRSVPHSGGSDDPDKQDSTPAQGMRCLEHENVLQEEGVQFRKLNQETQTFQTQLQKKQNTRKSDCQKCECNIYSITLSQLYNKSVNHKKITAPSRHKPARWSWRDKSLLLSGRKIWGQTSARRSS